MVAADEEGNQMITGEAAVVRIGPKTAGDSLKATLLGQPCQIVAGGGNGTVTHEGNLAGREDWSSDGLNRLGDVGSTHAPDSLHGEALRRAT